MDSGDPFSSLLGMSEMERAVKAILKKLEEKGRPLEHFSNMRVYPEDFVAKNDLGLLVGFVHLVHKGWLAPGYPNSEFFPTKALVIRMRSRECWKDLPDADEIWHPSMSKEDMMPLPGTEAAYRISLRTPDGVKEGE